MRRESELVIDEKGKSRVKVRSEIVSWSRYRIDSNSEKQNQ